MGTARPRARSGSSSSRRRDGVTVTTKLGIVPPRRSRALQAAKAVARVAVEPRPGPRAPAPPARPGDGRRRAASTPARRAPASRPACASWASTHVDILLLHECRPAGPRRPRACSTSSTTWCARARSRYFGIGTDVESTRGDRRRATRVRAASCSSPTTPSSRALERDPAWPGGRDHPLGRAAGARPARRADARRVLAAAAGPTRWASTAARPESAGPTAACLRARRPTRTGSCCSPPPARQRIRANAALAERRSVPVRAGPEVRATGAPSSRRTAT